MIPEIIKNEMMLEKLLSQPSPGCLQNLLKLKGDFLVLGAGGKMGPVLSRMLKRALPNATITAVSRFSDKAVRKKILSWDVKAVECDLLDPEDVKALPDAENIIFMAGMKFGTGSNPALTWAQNTFAPSLVSNRFRSSRILSFSTGNVYPFWPDDSEGPCESDPVDPVGEYAQSCVGRERIFQYFSDRNKTPTIILRLNYACEMRYGILVEIGRAVLNGEPVDLRMGYVNVIWEGDVINIALQALTLAKTPAGILNIAGPKISVREIALKFGKLFNREPVFSGSEDGTSLISNGTCARELFGTGEVDTDTLVTWTANWLSSGKSSWEKPTHFQEKDGKF